MVNFDLINHFYSSFAKGDAEGMISCYDSNIIFQDPVFGQLKGENVMNMRRMLLSGNDSQLKIKFENIKADNKSGSADWTAEYIFSKTGKKVINKIHAIFEFQNGRIIKHSDHFDIWKWSKQAFGWKGLLIGWTPFMKSGIRKFARKSLEKYTKESKAL